MQIYQIFSSSLHKSLESSNLGDVNFATFLEIPAPENVNCIMVGEEVTLVKQPKSILKQCYN